MRGVSDEAVTDRDVPKSMLACKSFAPTSSWDEIGGWLRVLCEELAARMATDSAQHARRPRNLVVAYRRRQPYVAGTVPGERSRCSGAPPPHVRLCACVRHAERALGQSHLTVSAGCAAVQLGRLPIANWCLEVALASTLCSVKAG